MFHHGGCNTRCHLAVLLLLLLVVPVLVARAAPSGLRRPGSAAPDATAPDATAPDATAPGAAARDAAAPDPVLGAVAVAEIGALFRAIAPLAMRAAHVRDAARATFYERGVHATTKRTGVLVYIALRERVVELVGDVQFVAAVDAPTRARWAGSIAAALPDGVSLPAASLAWIASRPGVTSVIPGARTTAQARSNADAGAIDPAVLDTFAAAVVDVYDRRLRADIHPQW